MHDYAQLHQSAATGSVTFLHVDHLPVDDAPIDKWHGWLMGAALLQFDFIYGNFVRWLGGEYMNGF